jgi:hypothetical protein
MTMHLLYLYSYYVLAYNYVIYYSLIHYIVETAKDLYYYCLCIILIYLRCGAAQKFNLII